MPPRRGGFGFGRPRPARPPRAGVPVGGYGGQGCGCGCLSPIIIVIAVIVVLAFSIPASCSRKSSRTSRDTSPQVTTTQTTTQPSGSAGSTAAVKRQKLAADKCVESSEWLDDQAGWLSDRQTVIDAERIFYERCGVQPYLVIADEVNGSKDYTESDVETYLRKRYDELFSDDGHLILFFCEAQENEYDPYLLVGTDAQQVVDADAENLIYDAIDRWYTDSSLTDDQYFARVFQASSDAIMNGTSFQEYD